MSRLVTVPRRGHPLVKRLVQEMRDQRCTYATLGKRAGVGWRTISHWRNGIMDPQLGTIEACFNALGYELVPREREH